MENEQSVHRRESHVDLEVMKKWSNLIIWQMQIKKRNIILHALEWQKLVTQVVLSADKEVGKKNSHKHLMWL